MDKLIYYLTNRCHRKGEISENRWHCKVSKSDERKLMQYGLEVDLKWVECPYVNNCKAFYTLREILKVEDMDVDPHVPSKYGRGISNVEPMDVDSEGPWPMEVDY